MSLNLFLTRLGIKLYEGFLLYEIKILVFFEHLAVRLQTLNGVYGSLIHDFGYYEGQIPQKLEASI